jgi:SAM-dependent methyltransferase
VTPRRLLKRLAHVAAQRYRQCGVFAYRFALGKLDGDPVFAALLERGMIPPRARLLDLGCGQGVLAAWIDAAGASFRAKQWPERWPPPPDLSDFRGIEWSPRDAARAQAALGSLARIECADIRTAEYGKADVIIILDVLHYMNATDQQQVLQRVRSAIGDAGRLLLRVGDAAGGWRFTMSLLIDSAVLYVRGHRRARLHCRSLQSWHQLLASCGFIAQPIPMSAGTPFANVLLVATPR